MQSAQRVYFGVFEHGYDVSIRCDCYAHAFCIVKEQLHVGIFVNRMLRNKCAVLVFLLRFSNCGIKRGRVILRPQVNRVFPTVLLFSFYQLSRVSIISSSVIPGNCLRQIRMYD